MLSRHYFNEPTLFLLLVQQGELLHSLAPIGFSNVQISPGVNRQSVGMVELAGLMTRTAKASQQLAGRMIQNMNLFVAAVRDV